jgi:hypothetical protein
MAAATVKVLAAYGADVNAKDNKGNTPLDVTPAYTNGGECKAKTRDARDCVQVRWAASVGRGAPRAAAQAMHRAYGPGGLSPAAAHCGPLEWCMLWGRQCVGDGLPAAHL